MSDSVRMIATFVAKELRVELRTRELLYTSGLFALVLLAVFLFAGFDERAIGRAAASGIVWVSVAFVGSLIFARTFQRERDERAIDALLLIPNVLDALFIGKVVVNVVLLLLVELWFVPLTFAVFSSPATEAMAGVAFVLLLGTVGFCALGTVLGATLATVRMREVILPLVLYPLCIPLLVAGVRATSALGAAGGWSAEVTDWVGLIVAFDALYLVVARWLFGAVLRGG